ncbi:hypothetical protein GCM10011506_44250 [Marivirga lumbricoides]|uniref:Fibronectin type-III domain-containing protein n=2 Tax=Marivirga lumbricoides TaxID=1046115 RepID=A0ABQ1N812_9BACT|nr:hypothetical protein GCM10011506_44250 [Marivirga lumbricoides]
MVSANAQRLPATINTTVSAPYSVYLSDYYQAGSNKLTTNIIFNDYNEPSWDVRLRLTIESTKLKIQTRPDFFPVQPLNITPGVPVMLSGADLAEYFDFNNLNFSGISAAELRQNARLPEGMYSFCFEVLDYRSGKVLSSKSCANAWLILQDPPRIINPLCDTYVEPAVPQNILFQWQQANAISPNTGFGPSYKLHLYEVTDPSTNPRSAIANGKTLKIFESELLNQTNYLYNIASPTLDPGKLYVYQVQAIDPEGKDVFKNQGYSEVCWFYFGYPMGGSIALNEPLNESGFSKKDPVYFKWSAPDKRVPGQPFAYYLKIVKVNDGQEPEQAMLSNTIWYEKKTNPLTATTGFNFLLDRPLDPMTDYAWQVIAVSGQQEVAKSTVFTFRGPGIIEQFNAGMHIVQVSSTESADLTKLSGIGKVRWSKTDTAIIKFENLKIKELTGGRFVLESGEIIHEFPSIDTIALQPQYEKNGKAVFAPERFRLNKDALSLQGKTTWDLPHPAISPDVAQVVSDTSWLNFDKYKLNGRAYLNDKNTFDLLDPYGFKLSLDTVSAYVIQNNTFYFKLYGAISLPEKVKTKEGGLLSLPIHDARQLFYITPHEQALKKINGQVALLKNADIFMLPQHFIIDLSEEESPAKLVADKAWKGVYIDQFKLNYKTTIDKTDQLSLQQELEHEFAIEEGNEIENWVSSKGLDLKLTQQFNASAKASFNEFQSQLYALKLSVINNSISESHLKGGMLIPFIDTVNYFSYTIPLSDYGFKEGYMDQLDETNFTFNKGGGEQEVKILIKRAVFANRNRLDMALDLEWPSMGVELKAVNGFKVWGNNAIGFGQPNGAVALNKQVNAKVSGFPITIDGIGAGSSSGQYSFGISGKVMMAEDVSGNTGPPEANIYTVAANSFASKESNPTINYENATGSSGSSGDGGGTSDVPLPTFDEKAINASSPEIVEQAEKVKNNLASSSGDTSYSSMDIALLPVEQMDSTTAALFQLYNDFNQRQKVYFDSLLLLLSDPITVLINAQADKLNAKITTKINQLTDSLNEKIGDQVGFLVENLRDRSLTMVSAENTVVYEQINGAAARIQTTITKEVQAAIVQSVGENVTVPLTFYIKEELAKNAAVYIKNEMVSVGLDVKAGEGHAEFKGNVGKKLEGLAKVIFDQKIDFKKLLSNLEALGQDAFKNIDTKLILDQLVGEVAVIVAKAAIEAATGDALDNLSESIGISIPMDFSDLGDKIRKGDLKGALALDPVFIKINTKFVSLNGVVKHTPEDPVYGTVWRGNIDFAVKVPKPFSLDGVFINGRKGGNPYWFCQISPGDGEVQAGGALTRRAKPFDSPVNMGPVSMVGASGRVYSHMRDEPGKAIVPDSTMKYGAYLNFVFFDADKKGSTMRLDVAAGIEMQESGDYVVEFDGNMQLVNTKPDVLKIDENAMALGVVSIKYNSAEEHFIGYGAVTIDKPGALCASGSILVDVKPGAWRVALGSREERLTFVPGCAGWSPTGWLDVNQNTAELGLGLQFSVAAGASFKAGVFALGIRVDAGVAFGLVAKAQYSPSFMLLEAGVWVDLWGRVIVDYQAFALKGSVTLVDLYCQGNMLVKFNPKPSTISGNVSGYVKLVGIISCSFDAGFEKVL